MTIPQVLIARRRDNQQPRAIECDGNGNIYTTPAGAAAGAVRIVDVAGDSCMDEVNNALQVNVVRMPAALGQGTMAQSLPVVIASNQSNVPVSVASTVAPAAKAGAVGSVHEPAANTAAVVTLAAAGGGVSNVLGLAAWSYDVLPTAGSLTIEDGAGSTIFKADVPESGPGFFPFNPGLKGTANTALIITLAAGGAGVSGIVSLHAWTE